jgi:uncharacterized membrane protein YoaK (UPF0700 family)
MVEGTTRTLLILTFVTGIVDAVAFVGLGQVFAAMQTGNVIFLGLGIGGSAAAPVGAPLLALAAFLLGGLAAVMLSAGRSGPGGLRAMVAVEVALLAGAALLAILTDPAPKDGAAYVLIAVLAGTMGLRNTVARRVGGPNLATTVLNLSLAPLAAAPAVAADPADLRLRAIAFATILAGAVAGALLLQASVALALAGAAIVSAVALWSTLPAAPAPE